MCQPPSTTKTDRNTVKTVILESLLTYFHIWLSGHKKRRQKTNGFSARSPSRFGAFTVFTRHSGLDFGHVLPFFP